MWTSFIWSKFKIFVVSHMMLNQHHTTPICICKPSPTWKTFLPYLPPWCRYFCICGLCHSKLINANTLMCNANSITGTLLPALSRVRHTRFSCREDVHVHVILYIVFVCLAFPRMNLISSRACVASMWASVFVPLNLLMLNDAQAHTPETMATYKLWGCTLINCHM